MTLGEKWITVLAVGLVLTVLCTFSAGAEVRYQVIDLGAAGISNAFSINNLGQIAGCDDNGAFIWSSGNLQQLGGVPGYSTSEAAYGINNNGDAVGYCSGATSQATAWLGGVATPLQSGLSRAQSINDLGQIVGRVGPNSPWYGQTTYPHAFLYDNGNVTMLDAQTGYNCSEAYSINNNSQIAGWVGSSSSDRNACIWNGTSVQLLGFKGCTYGINDNGVAVGSTGKAFLWQNGTTVNLGALGLSFSTAQAINNNGQVVGHYTNDSFGYIDKSRAFLYENNVMLNLNTLIASNSGWNLLMANDINDHGQIVGIGNSSSGTYRAFLLNPVPEPGSLVALLSGLAGLALVRRRR